MISRIKRGDHIPTIRSRTMDKEKILEKIKKKKHSDIGQKEDTLIRLWLSEIEEALD